MFQYNFRFANQDALYWVATHYPVVNYLEIGVWQGDSLQVVLDAAPVHRLVLCDLWSGSYELRYKNHDHIAAKLAARGWVGDVTYLDGDSKLTVPAFHRDFPHVQFDLIHVDGDHNPINARKDLENVWPMLHRGGHLVLDDILYGTPHPPTGKFWLLQTFSEFVADHADVEIVWVEMQKQDGFGLVRKK